MLTKEFERDVLRTAPTNDVSIADKVTYSLMGICGEAGEAMEIWKKHLYQGHPWDEESDRHIISEVGDVLFYVALFAVSMGLSLDDLMRVNVEKRKKRYPKGFDPERSLHRDVNDV